MSFWIALGTWIAALSSAGLFVVALVAAVRLQARERLLDRTENTLARIKSLHAAGLQHVAQLGKPYFSKRRWFLLRKFPWNMTAAVFDDNEVHYVFFTSSKAKRRSDAVQEVLGGLDKNFEFNSEHRKEIDEMQGAEVTVEYEIEDVKILLFVLGKNTAKFQKIRKIFGRFKEL